MAINWNKLTDFFEEGDLEWKPIATTKDKSKGLAAAYVTARAIQDRLDDVFGPGGWKNEYRAGPDGGVICRIHFRNDEGEWVWREDGAENTNIEAVKGGLSGALKRAGSALGIGRYLYRMPDQWVPLDQYGRFSQTPRVPPQFLPKQTNGAARERTLKPAPEPEPSISESLVAWAGHRGIDEETLLFKAGSLFGVTTLDELTKDQANQLAATFKTPEVQHAASR